jgi:predicted XRE-type DNA-binding protein
MSHTKTYASVWDAIADTPEQAANLRARAELMRKIAAIVKESKWTQTEAAARCGITQPRMNDLLRGRLSRFSLDALFNIAAALGLRISVEIELSPRRGVRPKRETCHVPRRRNSASR